MAIVVIESPSLSADQKARVGERVITALQHEGMAPGSVVVLFRQERSDIYLDGLLIQSQSPVAVPVQAPPRAQGPRPSPRPGSGLFPEDQSPPFQAGT